MTKDEYGRRWRKRNRALHKKLTDKCRQHDKEQCRGWRVAGCARMDGEDIQEREAHMKEAVKALALWVVPLILIYVALQLLGPMP